MPVAPPTNDTRWRCAACGNLTRFDVVRSLRLREYVHADLTGETVVEESETLGETVEHVTCRWCGAVDQVELVPRPGADDALGVDSPATPATPAMPAEPAPAMPAEPAPADAAPAAP